MADMAQATSTNAESQLHRDSTFPLDVDDSNDPLPSTRIPFQREKPWASPTSQYQQIDQHDEITDQAEIGGPDPQPRGLGLTDVPLQNAASPEIKRVPVGSRTFSASADSPGFGGYSQATTAQNTANLDAQAGKWPSPQSSRSSLKDPPYQHSPSNVNLLPQSQAQGGCPTQGDLLHSNWTGLTVMILFLAFYSTLFSAIFLFIAIAKPRWGHRIGPRGALSYDTATLLSALFSKTVELTFATTFVVTLGQILTRRAFCKSYFSKTNKGISIADVNMRLWIMQPGTLFTHWSGAKYAVTSFLGLSALVAAFATSLYTTAAESLVSPKLKFGRNESLTMIGQVSSSYANAVYLGETCSTPITPQMDQLAYGLTCLQISFAGNGFRTLDTWLAAWDDRANSNQDLAALAAAPRPHPVAVLYENTTVEGQWVYPSNENITEDSDKYGRLINNVTLVMPHANVFHAARSSRNRILQPEDLQGSGEYYIKAAVPAPALNVLCVGATAEELAPMIASNETDYWPVETPFTTVFDDMFGWRNEPEVIGEWYPPWFPKLPKDFNTVINTTATWGAESVYLLGKPSGIVTSEYVLCGLRSFLYSNCSTSYHVAQSGGQLSVHCGADPENWKSYAEVRKPDEAPFPTITRIRDWKDVGGEWIRAVALSQGNVDSDASSSRLMTQLIPEWTNGTSTILKPILPSIAEALGVLASYTLIVSSDASQFVHFWDYAKQSLEEPADSNFTARLAYKDYASGGDQRWKGIFYLVLTAAFFQNLFCLLYLLWHFCRDGELTDFTEPQNLFALAMNSPPSRMLAGACGGGPVGRVLGRKWCVKMNIHEISAPVSGYGQTGYHQQSTNPTHPHFYVRYPEEDTYAFASSTNHPAMNAWVPPKSPSKYISWIPLLDVNKTKRRKTPRPKSMNDFHGSGGQESPALAQYRRLVQ